MESNALRRLVAPAIPPPLQQHMTIAETSYLDPAEVENTYY